MLSFGSQSLDFRDGSKRVKALATKHLITVAEFGRMAEAGVFSEDERLELIEGEIIERSPIGRRHAARVRWLINLLTRRLGTAEAVIDAQDPLVLGELSNPQPDLVLLKPRADFYADGHPQAADVLLLIEVADTSLVSDREVKVPLYAQHGIPEVWLIDLEGAAVEVFREPTAEGYLRSRRLEERQTTLSARLLPQLELTVGTLAG